MKVAEVAHKAGGYEGGSILKGTEVWSGSTVSRVGSNDRIE